MDKIIQREMLSEDAFRKTIRAYHKDRGIFVALKSFKQEFIKIVKLKTRVLNIINEIIDKDPNLSCFLKYNGLYQDSDGNFLLEFESGEADLSNILKVRKKFTVEEIIFIMRDLIKGLAKLQEEGFSNGDIKPQNIILMESPNGGHVYKMANFGIGCLFPTEELKGFASFYASPEIKALYSSKQPLYCDPFKADTYALGVTITEMMGIKNYRKEKHRKLFEEALEKEYAKIKPFLLKMLVEDPSERVNFIELNDILEKSWNTSSLITTLDESIYLNDWLILKDSIRFKEIDDHKDLLQEHKEFYQIYYNDMKKLHKAKFHIERANEILNKIFPNYLEIKDEFEALTLEKNNDRTIDREEIIFCLASLGDIHRKMGNLKKSEEFLQKCMNVCIKFYGDLEELKSEGLEEIKKMLNFEKCFEVFGNLYHDFGNVKKSKEYYSKSMKINIKFLKGQNSMPYGDLGVLPQYQDDFDFIMQDLILNKKVFGEVSQNTANSYNNLALLYESMNNLQKAEEFYLATHKLLIRVYGENHEIILSSLDKLVKINEEIGNLMTSLEFQEDNSLWRISFGNCYCFELYGKIVYEHRRDEKS